MSAISKYFAFYIASSIIVPTLIFVSWLALNANANYPWFWPNAFLHNVNTQYLDYGKEFDFAIAYNTRSSELHSPYKILACKDDYTWIMITKRYNGPFSIGFSSTTVDTLPVEDATMFTDSLKQHKLFYMPDESSVLEKCGGSVGDLMHGETMEIEIIQGLKVRRISYLSPEYRHSQYPEIEEWRNLCRIKKFFETKWIR